MKNPLLLTLILPFSVYSTELTQEVQNAAAFAHQKYTDSVIDTLGKLVSFPTVHEEGKENKNLSAVKQMSAFLKQKSKELGLDFKDFGDVAVISLGNQTPRLGLITHGDVQPAETSKWKGGPFQLDTTSEPGKLIGRGAEDDKGSIALAMYAMKAIKDQGIPLKRKIELYVSYTEESDWEPFQNFLKNNPPPELNVGFDADYPVVVAQKGWCSIKLTLDGPLNTSDKEPYLKTFTGGSFMSQVPEDSQAIISKPDATLENDLKKWAKKIKKVQFTFENKEGDLIIRSRGKSAHSSTPEHGVNAISYMADLLSKRAWPLTPAALAVTYIHDLVGTGYYGEKFGKIAYKDPFMGPLTLSLSMVTEKEGKLTVGINIRRPSGKEHAVFESEIKEAVENWKKKNEPAKTATLETYISDPHNQLDAPQVPALLNIFSFYTKEKNPKPISVGGGTHARLVPHGVDFGPAMPNVPYTGHSEHEFITQKQLEMNLKMYTAMIATLGSQE